MCGMQNQSDQHHRAAAMSLMGKMIGSPVLHWALVIAIFLPIAILIYRPPARPQHACGQHNVEGFVELRSEPSFWFFHRTYLAPQCEDPPSSKTTYQASSFLQGMRHMHDVAVQTLQGAGVTLAALLEMMSMWAEGALSPAQLRQGWNCRGHIGEVSAEVARYADIARGTGDAAASGPADNVSAICEIGFNAGHSAAVLLAANANATLYSFDLFWYPYSKRSRDLVAQLFPQRCDFKFEFSTQAKIQ